MELGQLRALRELGDRGSIAAVAAAMRVTPSSVSQQLSALQRKSPVPLTFKDGRRTALTDAGRALARSAVEVEVALARASQAVARFQSDSVGTVSVAAFHSAGLAIFGPMLVASGRPGQPRITVSDFDVAQEGFPSLTPDHDLVIAHRLIGSSPWPASVRVEPLLFEPLDVAVRRGHRLAAKESIEPEDLRGEAWVAVHEGFPLESAVTLIASMAGAEAHIRHRVNDFFVAATVIAATDCVALMPRFTTDFRTNPDVVLRPLSQPAIGRYIDCLARPETLQRDNVRSVLTQLRAIATDLSATDSITSSADGL
ncbi:MAG: LysR family transcriptional regulator [Terrimesophilobacter sp.]